MGLSKDLLGNRSQREPIETTAAVRTHHNEVRPNVCGALENPSNDGTHVDADFGWHTGFASRRGHGVEVPERVGLNLRRHLG